MKKLIIMFLFLIPLAVLPGQQPVNFIFKARALTLAGNPDSALDILTKALNEKKESILFIERAEVNVLKGDYSAAISDYNESNKILPNSGEYGLARIYSLKGDPSTSLYHLELNLRSDLKKSEKEIMLEPAFKSIERSPEWRKFWRNEWYTVSERGISEIEYYVSTGKLERSEEILSDLKKNFVRNEDILYAESLIHHGNGKYQEAIKVISGLVSSFPGNVEYLRLMAKAQDDAGNHAGASSTYTELFKSGVADPDLLLLRAECFRKTGEHRKAMTDIESFLEIYPADKTALSLAGKVSSASGDNLKALEYFSENLSLYPNDPQCYIDRADAYFVSKSWDWAIKDYSMSLDLKPDNSDIWLNKGIALLRSGRVEDACHDFKRSLRLGNKRVAEYISRNCIK